MRVWIADHGALVIAHRLPGARGGWMEFEASEVCGCIACERIYFPSEIVRWVVTRLRRVRIAGWMRWWGPRRGYDYARGAAAGS